MKKIIVLAGLFSVSALAIIFAEGTTSLMPGDKPGVVTTDTVSIKATVVKIDYKTREMTLKDETGELTPIVASEDVVNFPQIKKGDMVTVDYLESVALFVRSPNEAPAVGQAAAVALAAPGQKPSGTVAQTQEVAVTVVKVNSKKRELVLKSVDGTKQTVKVSPEVKRFDQIKKGDQIVARTTTAVAIAVRKP